MTRMVLSALVMAGVSACAPAATGGGAGSTSGPTRVLATGAGAEIQIAEDAPVVRTVPAAPEQVWAALPSVFQAVGITGGAAESGARIYGNRKLVVRRRLADQPVSRYLTCGRTSSGHAAADIYRIHLSVVTSVQPAAGGGSQLQTEVTASAQNTEGTSTTPVRCASTGALEERIARLAGGQP